MNRILHVAILSFLISSCGSMPETRDIVRDQPAQLAILSPPANMSIFINDQLIGQYSDVTQDQIMIPVDEGTVELVIRSGSRIIFEDRIFITEGTEREINLSGSY